MRAQKNFTICAFIKKLFYCLGFPKAMKIIVAGYLFIIQNITITQLKYW